jgi:hypothetical protein
MAARRPLGSFFETFFVRTIKELAQNVRGIKHATQMFDEFLGCLAARIRALCPIGLSPGS